MVFVKSHLKDWFQLDRTDETGTLQFKLTVHQIYLGPYNSIQVAVRGD